MSDRDAQIDLMACRGLIASLPEEMRAKTERAEAEIRRAIAAAGECGLLALALVGNESQCDLETRPG